MRRGFLYKLFPTICGILGIFVSLGASAQVTFLGDWADFGSQFTIGAGGTTYVDNVPVGWVAGHGANHWKFVMEKSTSRLTSVLDSSSPHGGAVLKVEVLPGDSTGATGERSEVVEMIGPTGALFPVKASPTHEFYAVSIKLDTNWQPPLHDATHQNTWGLFMQLHSPNEFDSSPAIALSADTQFSIQTLAGDLIGPDGKRRTGSFMTFTNGTLQAGHWVEFILDVVWAYDNSGSLSVYRRDEGETAFATVLTQNSIPTLQFDSALPNSQNTDPTKGATYSHYWRAGYYRNISPGVTSRLTLGRVVRGNSMQQVEVAAFRQSVIPKPPSAISVQN